MTEEVCEREDERDYRLVLSRLPFLTMVLVGCMSRLLILSSRKDSGKKIKSPFIYSHS